MSGSKRWRYARRDWWCPARNLVNRASSACESIWSVSVDARYFSYTDLVRSCVGSGSEMISLITLIALDKEIGRASVGGIVVASFAAASASSFPGMLEWPGIHWIMTCAEMDCSRVRILSTLMFRP